MLRATAAADPDRLAYTYLDHGALAETHLSYGQLDAQARAVAVALSRAGIGRSRGATDANGSSRNGCVLVVFPTGFEFVASFLGTLYAGAIAVPVRYPNHAVDHLSNIAADCAATIGLTTSDMQPKLERELSAVRWLTVADINPAAAAEWRDTGIGADDVAYLQYTSGSTAAPKGVVICHRHIMANCHYLSHILAIAPDSRLLSWLPHFHDFGLVFGLLEPLYNRCAGFIMSPMTFAQRPLNWLRAISLHRITHSAAPNFGYQACLGIAAPQLEGLDLTSLRVSLNGAEPVRADTIEAFTRRLEPYGFGADVMCPGYGLAEATLAVSICGPGRLPVYRDIEADALAEGVFARATEAGRLLRLVGAGRPSAAVDVAIVDPQTGESCPPGRIGEIWLAGASVAAGYWNNPQATAEKFDARLAGSRTGPFLRTGDLGAIEEGELFVLGRMDDLIIIRGANYAPEDIEITLESADPALRAGGGVAVAVDLNGEPRLVVFHEVERQALRQLDGERLVKSILRIVSDQHQLEVSGVVLLKPSALPRTHSGKKQRHACRRAFLDGSAQGAYTWIAPGLHEALDAARSGVVAGAAPARGPVAADNLANPDRKLDPNPKVTMMHASNTTAHAQAPADEPGTSERKVKDLGAWLRSYAGERLNSRLMDERRSIPPYVVLDLGNRGVLGLQAPERYGGLDLDNRAFARVLEQLAAIDLTLASFVTVNNCLGVRPILLHASAEKRDELLPILAPGRELAAFAMTEPGAGSNVRGIVAQGRPDGAGGWRLWGTKIWSGSAAWAGVINTFVRIDHGEPGAPRGVTGFIVRQGSPGLRMGPEALTMGLRAMVQNEVRLEGVRVTPADMLGDLGEGMIPAMDTMEFGRFSVAALSIGVIKRCLQLMVRHAGRRSIATGKLLANPVTLVRISDLTAAATALEALVAVVAERLDRKLPVPPELFCTCKSAGAEFAWRAADLLVQQLAGRGYVETNIAPQILRDARILRIFEGPTEAMNAHIGSRLTHRPEDLRHLLAEDLQQPTVAAEIAVAAARILERCAGLRQLSDPQAAEQWAFSLAGEVGAYGILLACIKHQAQLAPSPLLRRAEEWARSRFDRRLAKALATTAAEAVLLEAAEAERMVAAYVETIGDIEQSMSDEQRYRDPLIERDPADGATSSPAAAPPPNADDHGVPAAANGAAVNDTGRAREISAWLADWLGQAFDRPASDIGAADMFSEFGMDSVRAMMLISALEDWLGVDLPPTLIWDYPSVGAAARHLADLAAASAGPPAAAGAAKPSRGAKSAASRNRDAVDNVGNDVALLARVDQLSQAEIESLLAKISEPD
jgi:acyl-CoA synthetase (AMP-forming)/AMP-acid ligase II/alkylation response protein AidB-like acyl-CoA dehydrogenase/acyl carrier protein